MPYAPKTKFGGTLAVIDDNCNVSKFYAIAHALAEQLQVIFMNQVDSTDTLEWDFRYKNQCLTLHYNNYEGITIFPQKTTGEKSRGKTVQEVAHFLERMAF